MGPKLQPLHCYLQIMLPVAATAQFQSPRAQFLVMRVGRETGMGKRPSLSQYGPLAHTICRLSAATSWCPLNMKVLPTLLPQQHFRGKGLPTPATAQDRMSPARISRLTVNVNSLSCKIANSHSPPMIPSHRSLLASCAVKSLHMFPLFNDWVRRGGGAEGSCRQGCKQ